MNSKHFNNLYSFSFLVKNIEYGQFLKSVKIFKDVTGAKFAVDKFIFSNEAIDLNSKLLEKVKITLYQNTSKHYKMIYSIDATISKIVIEDDNIIVFIESDYKTTLFHKNGVSITQENSTLEASVKKYVDKINEFYKFKNPIKLDFNYRKNVNNYNYENMIFPIKNNHFSVIEQILKTYFILNSPFYFFFDDYSFHDPKTPATLNIYDLTNIKVLRAVILKDLGSTAKPQFRSSGTYYNLNKLYTAERVQKLYNTVFDYAQLKSNKKWSFRNAFRYANVPDTPTNAKKRTELLKDFYKKSFRYYRYTINDIDVTKFILGNRYVDDTTEAKIQYSQAIIDAEYQFYRVGMTDIIKNADKFSNTMAVLINFTTLSN